MRGFTLLEILISFTIMSLIVAGIFAIINVAEMSWNSDMAFLDIQQQVRLAMDGMTREVRQTKPSQITVSGGGGRIDFLLPKPTTGDYLIGYYLQGGRIIREHPTGTTKILANYINTLSFCCCLNEDCTHYCTNCSNANALRIQIQGTKTMRGRTATFPLTEKVMLRNE